MNVVDIFAALDNRHIIVTCNNLEEGWFFYDTDNPTNGGGNGVFYEMPEDAANAAAEFYGLLDAVEKDTRTVTFTDAQIDLILTELRESNSADWFVIHNESLDEEEIAEAVDSVAQRNTIISILVESQL